MDATYGDDCIDLIMRYDDEVVEGIRKYKDSFMNRYRNEGDAFVEEYLEKADEVFEGSSNFLPEIKFETSKLQHEYKHAGDFGIEGNWNKSNAAAYQQAIQNHIDNASEVYLSTYRGQEVYVYYNPETGLGSYVDMDGNYVSGWKLSEKQIEFHTTNGKKIK